MIGFVLTLALLTSNPPGLMTGSMCTCIEESFDEELKTADLIFEGIVLKKVPYPENWRELSSADFHPFVGFASLEYVFFLADRVWTGSRLNDLMVATPTQSSMCGYDFKEGERYLVYASIVESQVMTSVCTPTKSAIAAAADRRILDAQFPE